MAAHSPRARRARAPERTPVESAGAWSCGSRYVRAMGCASTTRPLTPTLPRYTSERVSLVVRRSRFHGRGVFTTRRIPAGTRVLEYTGERISHTEAARRYDDGRAPHAHTLLFTVDRRT